MNLWQVACILKNKHMKKLSVFLLIISAFTNSCKQEEAYLAFDSDKIQFTGRVDFSSDSAAIIYWPGTSIKINFEGSEVEALIMDEEGSNYYNVILDNDRVFVLHPDSGKAWQTIVTGISNGEHSLELFRRTEWDQGKTFFYGFQAGEKTHFLDPPPSYDRTIEFFGNSITAGYAIEDTIGDSPVGIFTNNYLAYGALTARHFDANYYCTAKSGIGITVSWFPMIMDEMYNRLDPQDSTSLWGFSSVQPDIVVVNLFQNDSWLVERPTYPEFISRFGDQKPTEEFIISEYNRFLGKIRTVYPDASIICALGSMDGTREGSKWPDYIEQAVEITADPDVYTCFFPYENISGHPEVKDHQKMADILIGFIEEKGLWN